MKIGDALTFVSGEGPPLLAPQFPLVIAALACRFAFVDNKPLLDTIEEKEGGEIERRHSWTFDARKRATFNLPGGAVEDLSLAEFAERFESPEWCKANADHPIAYLRAFVEFREAAVNDVKKMLPLIKIVRRLGEGDVRQVLIPQDASPEEKARFMAELNK